MPLSLIRGKHVVCKVTGVESAEVVSDGAVLQRDGVIEAVGDYRELSQQHPDAEGIGAGNHIVMPGMVNDHFHVGLTPFQMGAPDLPLEMWSLHRIGIRAIDPYLDQLYGAVQMIETGTTTVQAIHSPGRGYGPVSMEIADKVIDAYQTSGMRVSYAPSVVDQNSMVAGAGGGEADFAAAMPADLAERYRSLMAPSYWPAGEIIPVLDEICRKYGDNQHERVQVTMAPSNVHRCSDELLVGIKELAGRHSTGIHIHLQETVYQKLYGFTAYGKTPLQHLYDLGFLGPEVVCGHSVWATEEDLRLMAETGTNICHNASSNLRLQSGIAPMGRILEAGIKVAIGSDEAGLNDDKDLFQEMRLVLKIHRVPGIELEPPTSYQVLQMATANGAYASWFGDRIGTLEPGKRADMVLVDMRNIEEPFLDPRVSVVDALVHRGRGIDVETVLVDGEVVLRDKQLTSVDKEALFREVRDALDRPLTAQEEERRELARLVEPHLRRFYSGTTQQDMTPFTAYNSRV
ncbi:MAG: amidohydrolase family protein [Chloroflexi bacterium]|nr:amidohydrolase family protein [Chloroflexota bacterium]